MAVALEVGWGSDELGLASRMSKKRAWGDDHQKLLEMMMGKSSSDDSSSKHTLDLLGSSSSSSSLTLEEQQSDFLELGQDVPLPSGWEKRLDLKSGTVFFINLSTGKSTRDDPRLESHSCHFSMELLQSKKLQLNNDTQSLKKNTSAKSPDTDSDSTNYKSNTSTTTSLDLKLNLSNSPQLDSSTTTHWLLGSSSKAKPRCSSPEAGNKVSLTCCKRCLMYVMISQSDPRCPKCSSSVVIEFPMPKKPRINLEL